MDTIRLYARDKHVVWGSIKENGAVSNDECGGICNSVFNGEAVGELYMANEYIY